MKKLTICLVSLFLAFGLSGCLFTKIVTVPMRVVGAAVSIVPTLGDTAHDAIDEAADIVDTIPF